jgi:hypothetical protein
LKGVKKGSCPDNPPIRQREEIKRRKKNSLPRRFLFLIKELVNSPVHFQKYMTVSLPAGPGPDRRRGRQA